MLLGVARRSAALDRVTSDVISACQFIPDRSAVALLRRTLIINNIIIQDLGETYNIVN